MKEATGELSTTMIAIVAIAAVLTIFTVILLPYLKSSITSRMHCADAYDCQCTAGSDRCECKYDDAEKNQTGLTVRCTNPQKD